MFLSHGGKAPEPVEAPAAAPIQPGVIIRALFFVIGSLVNFAGQKPRDHGRPVIDFQAGRATSKKMSAVSHYALDVFLIG